MSGPICKIRTKVLRVLADARAISDTPLHVDFLGCAVAMVIGLDLLLVVGEIVR